MFEVRTTEVFDEWLEGLRDRAARQRIQVRMRRLAFGNPGQQRVLTNGVCEMKIDFGPGYRLYYTVRAESIAILLCGGDKGSQDKDIATAISLAKQL